MRRSLLNPILAFGILIIMILGFSYVGNIVEDYFPPQNPGEITSMPVGETVMAGMKVVDDSKIRKVPLLYHVEYLKSLLQEGKYLQIITGMMTGSVETPLSQLAGNYISPQGMAQGFEGPGYISVNGQKLVVNPPETFVWGYKTAYTVGVKTKDGLEIREGGKSGKIVKKISYSDINNNTLNTDFVNITSIQKWYNRTNEGNYTILDYSLTGFSDGRNQVTPDKIKKFFGDSVVNYMKNYPSGSPVMAYMGSHTENVTASSAESLGSHPEYGDNARAYNAMSFAKAWNGTIVPPKSSSHGKENVYFEGCYDPNATGGYATHGVCPAARSMRNAIGAAGLPTPTGIRWEELSVAYDTSPTVGVLVKNPNNYPIKIVMWTQGSGPGLVIYTKIVKLT